MSDGEDQSEETSGRALFVTGLPVLHHPLEAVLESLFSAFGEVKSVVVHNSQLSALILFSDESGGEKALRAAAHDRHVEAPLVDPEGAHGLKSWMLAHKAKFPGNHALKKQLDDWMEAYEKREQETKAAAAAGADEGWTVVTRKPGRRKTKDPETAIAVGGVPRAIAEARAAKKPVKQLENFYRHQKRDRQRSELLTLQKKFEEDKKKIAEMRASRRFKPY